MVTAKAVYDKSTRSWDLKFTSGKYEWKQVEAFITIMKKAVPASDRIWDPTTKQWSILEQYYEILKPHFKIMGFHVEETIPVNPEDFFYEEALSAKVVVTKESLGATLKKLLGVSDDVLADNVALKKAYRAAALRLHPDRNNGDGSKMSELNSVWSTYNAN